MKRALCGLVCSFAVLAASTVVAADARKEAADRFDRGLRLFNGGDNANALLEFKRAYELSGERSILLNVGLVQAELGRPVEAVKSLEQLLAEPSGITEAQFARARRTRDEQAARIGQLAVTTNEPAQLEIDNLVVGRTPLSAPLAVASGLRLLTVVASGKVPIRQEVAITGGHKTELALELLPAQGALANLVVRSVLPGADVLVDGKLAGRTPLPASITLAPGTHEVVLRRAGYRSLPQTITLADGSTGEVTLDATEDTASAELVAGLVSLDVSQPDANVSIDGVVRSGTRDGLRLPAGPHRLSVLRAGFMPFERELSVDKGLPRTVRIQLEPTAETRAAHLGRVSAQRRNAYLVLASGLVVAGAGAYVIFKKAPDQQHAADAEYERVRQLLLPGRECAPAAAPDPARCQALVDHANQMQDDAKTWKWAGWGIASAGAAVAVTGLVLRLLADDPDEVRVADTARLRPYAWTGPADGGLGVSGSF